MVVLDDDSAFLEMMGMTLPTDLDLRLYTDPDLCVNFLRSQVPFVEADVWAHREILQQWRQGAKLLPLVISYLTKHTERVGLARVLVLDYDMPRAAGTAYLGQLDSWPGHRVLLTGMEDVEAVAPFMRAGQVECIIAKQMSGMAKHLVATIRGMLAAPTELSRIWHEALNQNQQSLLGTRAIAKDLHEVVSDRCVEFVVLPEPFGVLGLDKDGGIHWLQLVDPAGLVAMSADAMRRGMPASVVNDVRSGFRLLDTDLLDALGTAGAVSTAHPAITIGPGRRLLGAWMDVNAASPQSYTQWLSTNATRNVLEA